jgi:NADP-dependent 3-hydroxy acid dehydrogenase YdfG
VTAEAYAAEGAKVVLAARGADNWMRPARLILRG